MPMNDPVRFTSDLAELVDAELLQLRAFTMPALFTNPVEFAELVDSGLDRRVPVVLARNVEVDVPGDGRSPRRAHALVVEDVPDDDLAALGDKRPRMLGAPCPERRR